MMDKIRFAKLNQRNHADKEIFKLISTDKSLSCLASYTFVSVLVKLPLNVIKSNVISCLLKSDFSGLVY